MTTNTQHQQMFTVINNIFQNWSRNLKLGIGNHYGYINNDPIYYRNLAKLTDQQYCQLAEAVAELFESGRWRHPKFSATDCMSVCLEVEQQMKQPTDGAEWNTERNLKRGCATKSTLFKFFRMMAETEIKTSNIFTNIINREATNVTIN